MKGIQKTITIIIWVCSILIALFVISSKVSSRITYTLIGSMFSVCIGSTALYFMPINEKIKAITVLLMIGIGCMGASICLGGNAGTFFISFLVLGSGTLFFEPVILGGYAAIYIAFTIIAYLVNPQFLVGDDVPIRMGIFEIISYAVISICLYIGTKYGKRMMEQAEQVEKEAQEKSAVMEEISYAANDNAKQIYDKISESDVTVKQLSNEAETANKNIRNLKESEAETIRLFDEMFGRIVQSTEWIEENYQLIEALKENFVAALSNVKESMEFSANASKSLQEIKTTITHAGECIEKSSAETDHIMNIIKDIDDIASRTNLLAINASIEAARVGEKGTGFDIVAEQIRTLSRQSKQASENIRPIIESLSKVLSITEDKVNNGLVAVQNGICDLDNMAKGIETIDYYSNQSQESLNKEVDVFEQMKAEFSIMVNEVEKSMDAAAKNMDEIQVVADAVQSQANRTTVVAKQLQEMEELTNQIKHQFETEE